MPVKKYGNRRLYDTAQSRYVTLEQIGDSVAAAPTSARILAYLIPARLPPSFA